MATPVESQIYSWGIKNPQTLAGAGRGENRIPSGYAHQSEDVAGPTANVEEANTQNSVNPIYNIIPMMSTPPIRYAKNGISA